MTKITSRDPKHWHDENGKHRMKDPRKLGSDKQNICHGDPDLRAYWDHLEAHDAEKLDVRRHSDDTPAISALFDVLENAQNQVLKAGELIRELRRSGHYDTEKK